MLGKIYLICLFTLMKTRIKITNILNFRLFHIIRVLRNFLSYLTDVFEFRVNPTKTKRIQLNMS